MGHIAILCGRHFDCVFFNGLPSQFLKFDDNLELWIASRSEPENLAPISALEYSTLLYSGPESGLITSFCASLTTPIRGF